MPEAPVTIVRSRLYLPQRPRELVARPRLIEIMDRALEMPVTLLSASAGYGKSVLAADWAHQQSAPIAWLSLESADSNLGHFLAYLIAALVQAQGTDRRWQTAEFLEAPEMPSVELLCSTLLNDLDDCDGPLVIVLDDYHHLSQQSPVHELIMGLLQRPLPQVHLLLVSRIDPPLPLSRLRAAGQLLELRMEDLRFSHDEIAELLRREVRVSVGADAINNLHGEIEGWAAGLHLVALATRHAADPNQFLRSLHGGVGHIKEYLIDEVMRGLDPWIRERLLIASVPEQFCADLIDVLYGASVDGVAGFAGREFIDAAISENLFIVALDEKGQWFRFHHLFREFLQEQLHRSMSAQAVDTLHLSAATWFESEGQMTQAIRHAVSTRDSELAVTLIARHRDMAFDQDNWLLVEQWLGLVPEAVIQRSRGLLLARTWVKSFRLDLDQVAALLNQLDALGGEPEAAEIHFFRGLVAFWSGEAKAALSELQQSVSLIGGQSSMLAGEMRAYYALSQQMCGDIDTAQRELEREIRLAGSSRTTYVTRIAAAQCYIHYMDANPMLAVRSARYLTDIAEVVDSCYARGWSQYLQALIHLNVGQLEAAETFFSAAVNHRHCVEHKVAMEVLGGLALTQQLRGCLAASEESALAMSDFAHRLGDTEVTELATSFRARLALLRGEVDEAVGLSTQLVLRPASPNLLFFLEEPAVTQLRVIVAAGGTSRLRAVLDTLTALRQQLEDVNQHCQLIDIFALQALAYHRLGQEAGALESLTRAVVMATPSEWVRPFFELGPDLEPLLQRLTLDGAAAVFVEGLLAMPQLAPVGQSRPAAAAPAEASQTLTHRELDILDLLSQRFRNKEIASALFISNHTVNYHLKHIYHKLGVNGRREAVARARDLGVLETK